MMSATWNRACEYKNPLSQDLCVLNTSLKQLLLDSDLAAPMFACLLVTSDQIPTPRLAGPNFRSETERRLSESPLDLSAG